jgi:outer membrane protein W
MKKLLFILVMLSSASLLYSQPKLTVGITSGYLIPMQELKGDMKDSSERVNTYEMKSGYSIGADGKYFLGKNRNLGLTLSLDYSLFANSEAYVAAYGNNVKRTLNTFNLGLGAEYDFIPGGKIDPFIGASVNYHIFDGDFEFTYGSYAYKSDLETAKRYGVSAGFGINIALKKSMGIVLGGKYNMANLFGKEYDSTRVPANTYRLEDFEHVLINNFSAATIDSKHISYLQFYLGVSFYFNQPKKKEKLIIPKNPN